MCPTGKPLVQIVQIGFVRRGGGANSCGRGPEGHPRFSCSHRQFHLRTKEENLHRSTTSGQSKASQNHEISLQEADRDIGLRPVCGPGQKQTETSGSDLFVDQAIKAVSERVITLETFMKTAAKSETESRAQNKHQKVEAIRFSSGCQFPVWDMLFTWILPALGHQTDSTLPLFY